mmetsp:Transcript_11054/g.29463  ORF Transcript_11054/g.29463 Transcript_11054/m.29463 type:complete len:225 (-) Transcript_11054:432-1106(-)
MITSFSRISSSCFRLCVRYCDAFASAWLSSLMASASPTNRCFSTSAVICAFSYWMSACTLRASASASALEICSTRDRSISTFVRSNLAWVSIFSTCACCSASMRAVDRSSSAFTKPFSLFSSAIFLLPFSLTIACSWLRFRPSSSSWDFRWISPISYSCSRVVFSIAFLMAVVFSRLSSSCSGNTTAVIVQLEKTTPDSANFSFREASMLSARFPRSVRTVWWD